MTTSYSMKSVFAARQADVFGQLANLESAHFERRIMDESLIKSDFLNEQEIERKEQIMESKLNFPQAHTKDSEGFLVPSAKSLPLKNRRGTKFTDIRSSEKNKWTHYSLVDVDEDAGMEAGGIALAASIIHRIKEREKAFQLSTEDESNESNSENPGKIVFRKPKRPEHVQITETNVFKKRAFSISINDYDNMDDSIQREESSENSLDSKSTLFIKRKAASRNFNRKAVDSYEDEEIETIDSSLKQTTRSIKKLKSQDQVLSFSAKVKRRKIGSDLLQNENGNIDSSKLDFEMNLDTESDSKY